MDSTLLDQNLLPIICCCQSLVVVMTMSIRVCSSNPAIESRDRIVFPFNRQHNKLNGIAHVMSQARNSLQV